MDSESFDESIWTDLMDCVRKNSEKFTQAQLTKLEKWANKDFTDIIESRKVNREFLQIYQRISIKLL